MLRSLLALILLWAVAVMVAGLVMAPTSPAVVVQADDDCGEDGGDDGDDDNGDDACPPALPGPVDGQPPVGPPPIQPPAHAPAPIIIIVEEPPDGRPPAPVALPDTGTGGFLP